MVHFGNIEKMNISKIDRNYVGNILFNALLNHRLLSTPLDHHVFRIVSKSDHLHTQRYTGNQFCKKNIPGCFGFMLFSKPMVTSRVIKNPNIASKRETNNITTHSCRVILDY